MVLLLFCYWSPIILFCVCVCVFKKDLIVRILELSFPGMGLWRVWKGGLSWIWNSQRHGHYPMIWWRQITPSSCHVANTEIGPDACLEWQNWLDARASSSLSTALSPLPHPYILVWTVCLDFSECELVVMRVTIVPNVEGTFPLCSRCFPSDDPFECHACTVWHHYCHCPQV